jgi:sugar phosphate isomerase/epimerase
LEYRLSEAQLKGLRPFLSRGELEVVSIHNPFPRRPEDPPRGNYTNRVKFSSLDPEERRAAVRQAAETLTWAAELGAGAVVLHLGEVQITAEVDPAELRRMVRRGLRETPAYEDLKEQVAAARRKALPGHRDAVLSSLDRLCNEAVKRGATLGLENRYHPVEIPDEGDLRVIFDELRGAPVGYWHDTGHGASLENLGFVSAQTELLETFQERLLGLHLHDARGLDDHLAPGEGELEFSGFAPFVRAETVLVVEAHPPAAPEAVARAVRVLEEAGFRTDTPVRGVAPEDGSSEPVEER